MKILDIVKTMNAMDKRIFTIADLGKIIGSTNKNTLYKTAENLVQKDILARVSKGVYINLAKPPEIFEIANQLYIPSYVSLESALYRYGIIAQIPYTITSVTTKKPKKKGFENTELEYVHIAPKYFFGYIRDKGVLIATREKALLDLLYLVAKKSRRFNLANINFKEIDLARFSSYLKYYSYLPLSNLLERLGL
jgi:predicted transcriptional regulator of viral defense system